MTTQKVMGPWLAIWLLIAINAYPLSLGPVCWLSDSGLVSLPGPIHDAIEVFYFPLGWAWRHSDVFALLMEWYVGLWE